MKILLVTATENEAEAFRRIEGITRNKNGYGLAGLDISLLITRPGAIPCAWHMMNHLSENGKPDLAINFGIAGSFSEKFRTGDVVSPERDCFADYGIEDGENYLSLFESGLSNGNEFPFENGWILCPPNKFNILKPVKGITRGTGSGAEKTIGMLVRHYDPDIETMEGAAFFYICRRERIPFMAIRAISNKVERRNRPAWNIPLALENLSTSLKETLLLIKQQ